MGITTTTTLFILLTLTLTLLQTAQTAKLKDITSATTVMEICQLTEYPKLCESSAGTGFSGKTNPEAILRKQIEVTIGEAERAEKETAELGAKDPTDDKRNPCYKDCAAHFNKAQLMLRDAVKAIDAKDVWKLETLLGDAVDHYEACDDAFEDNALEPLMEETTHQLQRLTSNCQYLARTLEK